MKIVVLASGSKGNATYIETKETKMIIDMGINLKQFKLRLHNANIELDYLDAIFITHEHTDHVFGLNRLMKNVKSHLFINKETFEHLNFRIKENIDNKRITFIDSYTKYFVNDCIITPFSISHDAANPFGFIIENENNKLVYLTDSGYVREKDYELLSNANGYIIESNHDVNMVRESGRPWYLQERIIRDKGHLSNEDCGILLANIVDEKTTDIVLAHRSHDCNDVELGLKTIKNTLYEHGVDCKKYNIVFAEQDYPIDIIDLQKKVI